MSQMDINGDSEGDQGQRCYLVLSFLIIKDLNTLFVLIHNKITNKERKILPCICLVL